MSSQYLFQILWSAALSAAAFFYASMGGLLGEKAGVLNLGLDGYMMAGAAAGIITYLNTGSPLLAFLAAIAVGMLVGALYAISTVVIPTNQVIAGMSLVFLLGNTANFYGQAYTGKVINKVPEVVFVVMMVPVALGVRFVINKTRYGLHLRAVGENARAADSAGISVTHYRVATCIISGVFSAISGYYISMSLLAFWSADMTGGRGLIAWSLIMFAKWRPIGVLLGSFIFGMFTVAPYAVQALGFRFPQPLLYTIQYVAPLLIMMLASGKTGEPKGLGQPCQRD